jgi:putative aminopeptidase FrvX
MSVKAEAIGDTLPGRFLSLLHALARSPSVVGCEHSFFRTLQRELEERGAEVTWYEGVLVAQGATPESVMFSAHVDRHGLICTGPNEYQYAAYVTGARSDLLGNSVSEQMMRKVAGRFPDERVFAYEPWSGSYCGRGRIRNTYICEKRNNLIFEVEGLQQLVAGTPVAFTDRLEVTPEGVSGQLDNVLTAAVLVYLFELGFGGTAFFTAQEEAGKSWRYLLEWFRRFGNSTNQLIVMDTSPFPDLEVAVPGSVVLRNRDANAQFNRALTGRVVELCGELGIPFVFKDAYVERSNAELASRGETPRSLGVTELGRIVAASRGLVDGTTLQVPTTGYHTVAELADLRSVASFLRLARALGGLPAGA